MRGSVLGPFLDTNIVLYLASPDEAKARTAEQLVQDGGLISVQVLNEIASVARRKMGMSWAETREFLSSVRELLMVVPLTEPIHAAGLRLAERYQFNVYDGMIVAAALDAGCDIVLSEDMRHDLVVDERLRIVNPFWQV